MRHLPFLLLATPLLAHGQHVVQLPELPPLVLPAGLQIDSVFLTFDPHDAIGQVMKGLDNRATAAFLMPDTRRALASMLPRSSAGGPSDLHCDLRVNVLRISEPVRGNASLAACAVNFDLIGRTDSGQVLLFEFGSTFESPSGLDPTGKHGRSIRNALEAGLKAFTEARADGRTLPRKISPDGHGHRTLLEGFGYPVLSVGAPTKGLYHTFMDLRDQRPDTSTAFTLKPVRNEPGRSVMVRMKLDNASFPHPIWGFSDGQDVFMDVGGRFVRLEREAGMFSARIPQEELSGAGAVIAAGMMFGIVGGLVTVSVLPTRSGGQQATVRQFDLDLATGALLLARSEHWRPLTTEQVFIHSRFSHADVVTLHLPDRIVQLPKNSYITVALPCRTTPIKIEMSTAEGTPVPMSIPSFDVSMEQVHLIKVDKSGGITSDHVGPKMADGLLRDRHKMTAVE